jgi:small subunit ribosomal protein S21
MALKTRTEVRSGNIEKALKQFKRKTSDSGHLQEFRDRKEYTKPTTKRRKQKLQAVRTEKLRIWNEKYGEY